MMKEITVVMPVYKVEKYVSECLDSIINQTFDCFECIIIDDCSPDNSMRLIEEKLAGYKGNISFRIVRNERNVVEDDCQNCGFTQVRINGLDGHYSQILVDSHPVFSALSGVYGRQPGSCIQKRCS